MAGGVVEAGDRAATCVLADPGVVDVAGDRLVRAERGGDQRLGMGQPALLGLELVVLPRPRLDRRDLVESVLQQVELAGPLLGVVAELVEPALHRTQAREGRPVLRHHVTQRLAGERVEGLTLRRGAEQTVLVGLPVHRHELVGDLGQQRGRHGGSAGERPGPTLRRQRTRQHHDAVVEASAGLGDRVGDAGAVGHRDARLHARPVVAGADEAEVGAVAPQQAERGDDHRLAGTGLTGDDGESLAQLELGGVDDAQRRQREVLPHQAATVALPHPAARGGATPAGDGKVELAHQPVGERSGLQPGQPDGLVAADHLDPRPDREVGGAASVAPQDSGGRARRRPRSPASPPARRRAGGRTRHGR